ncbi:MAG TPA: hypothetical protein VGJ64_03670, partial [Gemmatimonadaceae bacterium]
AVTETGDFAAIIRRRIFERTKVELPQPSWLETSRQSPTTTQPGDSRSLSDPALVRVSHSRTVS